MTLIYELDLKILQTYPRTKNELSGSRLLEVRASQTDSQTDTQTDATERITTFADANVVTIR